MMDDLRSFLAQNSALGYGSPAPQQTPMSSADRYAPGLMSPAPGWPGRGGYGGGGHQMAPGYDPQMGLQKALQGLLGGMGPSSSGVSLGSLAGGGAPGMGPSRVRY
jgi:hypothetical protein